MKKITLQKTISNKTIEEGYKEFNRYCRVRNLANETHRFYEESLYTFSKFLPLDTKISDINKDTIDDYILYLKNDTNKNDISINTSLRGIRVILHYFMDLEYMDRFKISFIKAEKKVKETYTDAELKLLLKKPNLKKCTFVEYRDWVIVNFLLASGCRANTICNIKIAHVDFDSEYIKLEKTKNKKQQLIPLSKTLAKVLTEYLQYLDGETEDYLFTSVYGQKLNANSLGHSIRKYNQRRGVMKTSIHLFRHTFAKIWVINKGDVIKLQSILGHSTLDQVREYVNMFAIDLQKDFDKFNALEQLSVPANHTMLKPSKKRGGK